MYTIDCDALAELPPAERLAEWERIARDVEQESVYARGQIVLAEIEAQTQAHGQWGARRRAAQALGLSPQRLSHMADRAATFERGRRTTRERTITTRSGITRTWWTTIMGEGQPGAEPTGFWATTDEDGDRWVLYRQDAPAPAPGRTVSWDLAPTGHWMLCRRGSGQEERLQEQDTERAMAEATRRIAAEE